MGVEGVGHERPTKRNHACTYVFAGEGLARQQVGPVLALHVQLVHRVPGIDVPRGLDGHHACVVGELLEGHGAVPLPLGILGHVQPQDVLGGHGLARDWALLVLLHVRKEVEDVKQDALWRAHGRLERLQAQGAGVEGQGPVGGAPRGLPLPAQLLPFRGGQELAVFGVLLLAHPCGGVCGACCARAWSG